MTMLLNILCLIQGFIFIVLAGFHFYWLFGGKWGLHQVIPTKKDSKHTSRIPTFATFLVAVILLSFSILYCHVSGFLSLSIIPKDTIVYALWIIPSVFTLRAIGEFKYVGLFKKIKDTTFAKADTLFILLLRYCIKSVVMRFFASLLVCIALLFSCSLEKEELSKKIIIAGHVDHFNEVAEHNIISFIYLDILSGQVELSETIDSNGDFKFEQEIEYPIECYLNYSDLLTYCLAPGDSIFITIDHKCWEQENETKADAYSFYKVSGTATKINEDMARYKTLIIDSLTNWKHHDSLINNSTPEQYKAFRKGKTEKRREILNQFNDRYKTSESFQEWANIDLTYSECEDLMRYCWLQPMNKRQNSATFRQKIPVDYFDFLDNWNKENKSYLKSKSYLYFLHEYQMHLDQLIPADTLKVVRPLYKSNYPKFLQFYLNNYQNQENNFMKDVLIAKKYYRTLDAKKYGQIKEDFDTSLVVDPYLKKRIIDKFNAEKELFDNPQLGADSHLRELAEESDFVKKLSETYPNKLLYIDFWAPWCAPCMGEMPYGQKLKKRFQGKEVVFIYVGVSCEENAWKSTIAEKKIAGEHYHLTDNQYKKVRKLFGITGIPHYVLVAKDGTILRKKAPRPSNGEELSNLITAHL